jgi:NifU-like protein involved in Fe-S cluster formation
MPEVEPLSVVADYRFSPFGTGCLATIAAPDLPARTVHGTDVHDALHLVMDEIGDLAAGQHRAVLTMHTLAGDAQAFAEIAEREGFAACLNDFA